MSRLEEIRERWSKVPAGPWMWGGSITGHYLYLSTVNNGRDFLMQFKRWGPRSAQPVFRSVDRLEAVYEGGKEAWSRNDGPTKQRVKQIGMVVKEQVYRGDIEDIDNPVAQCLKHSASDVAALLAEVDCLREALAAQTRGQAA